MNKILIIDDELPLLKIMTDQFSSQGFNVITAQNGAEGFNAAIKNHPDLILLDIRMPVMDGITMIKKLRQDKWGSDAAVMVLTNAGDSDNVSTLMNNKIINLYLKTDWKLEDIVRLVKERLPALEAMKSVTD